MSDLFEVGEKIRGAEEKPVYASDRLRPSLDEYIASLGKLITPEQFLRGKYLHYDPFLEEKYHTGRLLVGDFFELRQPSPRVSTMTVLDGLFASERKPLGFENRARSVGDRQPYGATHLFLDGELIVTKVFDPTDFLLNRPEAMRTYARHGMNDLSLQEKEAFYDWESHILSGNMQMRIGQITTTGDFNTGSEIPR